MLPVPEWKQHCHHISRKSTFKKSSHQTKAATIHYISKLITLWRHASALLGDHDFNCATHPRHHNYRLKSFDNVGD
jgi:hypothetical protein